MSLQVGLACYETAVYAGQAACASFVPVSNIDAAGVRSVSCSGADSSTGALQLTVAFTPTGGATSYSTISQLQSFSPCMQQDYIQAAEIIFGVLLAAWAIVYGAYKVTQLLHWNRGDHV